MHQTHGLAGAVEMPALDRMAWGTAGVVRQKGDLELGVVDDEMLAAQPAQPHHPGEGGTTKDKNLVAPGVKLQAGDPGTVRIEPSVILPLRLPFGGGAVLVEEDWWTRLTLSGLRTGFDIEAEIAIMGDKIAAELGHRRTHPGVVLDQDRLDFQNLAQKDLRPAIGVITREQVAA